MVPSRSQSASAPDQPSPSDSPPKPDAEEALRRLGDRVRSAVAEIRRLRSENQALKQQLEQLRQQPRAGSGEVILPLGDDPDELKRILDEYIEALDRYLSHHS